MTIPILASPPPSTSPQSTGLLEVLTHLGHRCLGGCGSAGGELDARVWFTRRRTIAKGRRLFELVVIDTQGHHGSFLRLTQLLRQVNACTTPDADPRKPTTLRRRRAGTCSRATVASRPDLTWPEGRPVTGEHLEVESSPTWPRPTFTRQSGIGFFPRRRPSVELRPAPTSVRDRRTS